MKKRIPFSIKKASVVVFCLKKGIKNPRQAAHTFLAHNNQGPETTPFPNAADCLSLSRDQMMKGLYMEIIRRMLISPFVFFIIARRIFSVNKNPRRVMLGPAGILYREIQIISAGG
ncbi:MAG: hypothetical protein IJP04_10810 [Clostridia bacterium]|nr:hypothetical protein [Clostridia bacterium]